MTVVIGVCYRRPMTVVIGRPSGDTWEQASEEYGRLIVEWVTGGYQS
jgi:hypothetical protein